MMTLEQFEEASEVVKDITGRTKLIYSDYLSDLAGNKVYLKPENLQTTGSFKIRGIYYKLSTLSKAEKESGLVTASAGNHAIAFSYAARELDLKATVVMPKTTPLTKVNSTKSYGAEVISYGDSFEEAVEYAKQLAEKDKKVFVHPYDDETIAIGDGSIAMEIIKELPTVDMILVPVGGGALIAGVAKLAKLLNPKIRVIGVEPAGACCMYLSMEEGKVITLDHDETIADGAAVRTPGATIFDTVRENVDEMIQIDDSELVVAFLDMVENHKLVVENAGLLSVAALKHLECENKKIVSVLSGGNMDVITVSSVVQHGLIQRGRIFTVSVLLPDKPGELLNVARIIAENQGNVVRLDHNQFVSINRNSAVELTITMEAFGHEHKDRIIKALRNEGYDPRSIHPKGF